MELAEPKWRADILAAVKRAKATRNFRHLEYLLDAHMSLHFDMLVQAIVRERLDEALVVLKSKYPGSVERQVQIEDALRGATEGP
jgi:hypothetical protein